jgi:GR25 family glycosyltransferase involved in LPS biosynthesis
MSVSLITACKNRNEGLKTVISSWLNYKEITEIIIVDWTSDDKLKDLTQTDDRIKVVRVQNEQYYIPSQANNLAASFVTNDIILRVDTDYLFNPYYNFFETYKIDETCFVSGEPEINEDRENNPYYKYLFGLLYITKNNFYKVNGYNENIGQFYSHEDKDIFERLKLIGLKQIKLKNNYSIIHIPHPDKKRFEYFKGDQLFTECETTIVNCHVGTNLNQFKQINTPYVNPVASWDIKQIEERYYEVIRGKNKLKNFPEVNCISLNECLDRRNFLIKEFKKYNINKINFLISQRFAESNDKIEGVYANTLNEGTAGCCVSHLKMIKNWVENSNEEIGFFCEDDLSLETIQYWNFDWDDFIQDLPSDWECIQLLTVRNDNLSLKCRDRLWNDWGATAYLLKRQYAKKIIDTYVKADNFLLQLPEPNTNIQPLIENLLFTIGKTYSIPLFIENINFSSTFVKTDTDIDAATLHKNNHIIAAQKVLEMWKENYNSLSINNKKIDELYKFSTNIEDPESNFKMGLFYYERGHTAPALSYFLRCAERTDNKTLVYEALIYGYLCYKEQKIRDETAKSLIMHALCLFPERPEARWLMSVFYEQKQFWMYSYYHAERGLEFINKTFEPLKYFKDYPGKAGLLFQKAISGYWWGKNDECKNILLDLYNNYELNDTYKQSVRENLKRIGVEIA